MEHGCVKTVLFDLDGTLRHNLPSGGEVFTDYAAELGLPVSLEDRERATRWEHYYWASSSAVNEDLKRFPDDDTAFWQQYTYRRLLVLCGSPQAAKRLAPLVNKYMEENYRPHSYVPVDVLEALQELYRSGISLGVLSNRHKPFRQELEALGLSGFFPFALAGGEVNLWKPAPEIFRHAAKQVKVRPAELVYVGDNYFADVVGAQRAGARAVLYDPRGIFPEPGCQVIRSFRELPALIERMKPCGNNA